MPCASKVGVGVAACNTRRQFDGVAGKEVLHLVAVNGHARGAAQPPRARTVEVQLDVADGTFVRKGKYVLNHAALGRRHAFARTRRRFRRRHSKRTEPPQRERERYPRPAVDGEHKFRRTIRRHGDSAEIKQRGPHAPVIER